MSRSDPTGESVLLSGLLRIDVRAEIRKLSDAQLQGSWQLGAECVRFAVQCKAQAIQIRTRRRSFLLSAQAASFSPDLLKHLARVLDEEAPAHHRHLALEAIEASKHPVLLLLLSQHIRSIRCTLQLPVGRYRLLWHRGQKAQRLRQRKLKGEPSVEIELDIPALDRGALKRSISELCRFCAIPIVVDRRPSPRLPLVGLARQRIKQPLPGEIALPDPSGSSRVWLLHNGVVRANLSLPARPWFLATLEFEHQLPPDASPADLRAQFEARLPGLLDASVELLAQSCRQVQDPEQLAKLRHWVVEVARIPSLLPRVEELPVFALHPPRQPARRLSLAQLAEWLIPEIENGSLVHPRPATISPRDLAKRAHRDTPLVEIEDALAPALCDLLDIRLPCAPRLSPAPWWSPRATLARLRYQLRSGGGLGALADRSWTRAMSRLSRTIPQNKLSAPLQAALQDMHRHSGAKVEIRVLRFGRSALWRGDRLLLPLRCPELRLWRGLGPEHQHAKELLWASLCALACPQRGSRALPLNQRLRRGQNAPEIK